MNQPTRDNPIDISHTPSPHPAGNRMGRVLWAIVWGMLYRPSPRPAHAWRRFLLRLFGARIGRGVHPYPSARFWAPWNLTLDDHSSVGDWVDCYCVAPIHLEAHASVSPYSFLCAASHDHTDPKLKLVTAPITIGRGAWVCADVFVAPGVTIGEGAVVGARSSVFDDVEPWAIVAGSPAKFIKQRVMTDDGENVGA